MKRSKTDRELGMDRPIDRRDFLNGMAVAVGALGGLGAGPALAQAGADWPQDQPGYYPPDLTGLRGSHPGSFEPAHALRDGDFWKGAGAPADSGERYDLVIVGGGISGLSAAYFYRKARPNARILILENHDDFGGHAKRNEFHLDGRLHLMNGGTLEIDSPRPYSPVADGLLKELGVDPVALAKTCDKPEVYEQLGLKHGIFFDKETFGEDRLVVGGPSEDDDNAGAEAWRAFLARCPLTEVQRREIERIETAEVDYLPGLSSAQKKARLSTLSYRDFLLTIVKADPSVIPFYQARTNDEQGVGIDALTALDCWAFGLPGFQGLKLEPGSAPHMGFTPAGYADGGSYKFHFPDGNATLARLLVSRLVPAALPAQAPAEIVTARCDYGQLDKADNPVRIRLSSIVVRARNIGDPARSEGVDLAYVRGGKLYSVRAGACVMASWNMMIPYICPELPDAQKAALHELVKTPLIYTTVALRNWTAFHKLGLRRAFAPGAYYCSVSLNAAVDIGTYVAERSPQRPILVHLTRTPCMPGLPEMDQNRAGRAEILATPFETFERNTREQLGRILGPAGFDPAHDILGITVNRWPHGYAPEFNPLFDADLPPERQPNVIGRARFGRITIANADSGRGAYTDIAIDQAHRAVGELLAL